MIYHSILYKCYTFGLDLVGINQFFSYGVIWFWTSKFFKTYWFFALPSMWIPTHGMKPVFLQENTLEVKGRRWRPKWNDWTLFFLGERLVVSSYNSPFWPFFNVGIAERHFAAEIVSKQLCIFRPPEESRIMEKTDTDKLKKTSCIYIFT